MSLSYIWLFQLGVVEAGLSLIAGGNIPSPILLTASGAGRLRVRRVYAWASTVGSTPR